MTLQAGFEALTTEAEEWANISQTLADAAGTVAGLGLTTAQFSWIASQAGVDASYETARQHVADVMLAGARETGKLATALREVRADFESTDDAVVADISAIWIPE